MKSTTALNHTVAADLDVTTALRNTCYS